MEEIGDVWDKERWYDTNPSLGILIQESTIEAECEQMAPDTFARERLGWWGNPNELKDTVIEAADWNACLNEHPTKEGICVYAVKFSPDGATGAMAACYKPTDGKPFVFVVDHRSMSSGLEWFEKTLTDNYSKAAQIVIDGQSNAQALTDRLLSNGVPHKIIIRPRSGDVVAACSWLSNAVKERQITHYGQEALNLSATRTQKRRIGNLGGWGFQSTDEADATLIESCALAYWGAMTTKRKPGRKAVIL